MPPSNHAVVMGATGLLGWGVVNELLSADSITRAPYSFGRVTALVNRPVQQRKMLWPECHDEQPELLVVDGIDLTEEKEKVTRLLRERVPDVETITHAFYFGENQEGNLC